MPTLFRNWSFAASFLIGMKYMVALTLKYSTFSFHLIFERTYPPREDTLVFPGESILLFTDGVAEAENENNELFGNDRLVR